MKFWWMFDNHLFADLGTDLDKALKEAVEMFDLDPYGSLFVREFPAPAENKYNYDTIHAHGQGRAKKDEFIASLAVLRQQVINTLSYEI